jgi:DNA mismatch endonuclease, patch repair protein
VFVDGDFWHGYLFQAWKDSVSPFWRSKIEKSRSKDVGNIRKLHSLGWIVIRIWGQELKQNADDCINKVASIVRKRRIESETTRHSRANR